MTEIYTHFIEHCKINRSFTNSIYQSGLNFILIPIINSSELKDVFGLLRLLDDMDLAKEHELQDFSEPVLMS